MRSKSQVAGGTTKLPSTSAPSFSSSAISKHRAAKRCIGTDTITNVAAAASTRFLVWSGRRDWRLGWIGCGWSAGGRRSDDFQASNIGIAVLSIVTDGTVSSRAGNAALGCIVPAGATVVADKRNRGFRRGRHGRKGSGLGDSGSSSRDRSCCCHCRGRS